LIAIVAVLGLAVDLKTEKTQKELAGMASALDIQAYLQKKMDDLATSRPTAVNLFNALAEIRKTVEESNPSTAQQATEIVAKHAAFMLERDVQDNKNIGKYGADELMRRSNDGNPLTVMTICNTGSLATALHGTALGVVRELRDRHALKSIVALETRPYNQGSRLTAFEMVQENMPGSTLICDSMASAFLRTHKVDGVVVGADRVCANGDTANKIGTYNLAVAARAHGVPFYVASPFTTFDTSLASGDEIEIEERPASEMLKSSNAPENVGVWNPAFDVTPASYITGIVTDKGVIHPQPDGTFDIKAYVERQSGKLYIPSGYTEQTVSSLPTYLAQSTPETMKILGVDSGEDLECVEMGDGNLNLVFIVTNKSDRSKQVIVKQSLPYVRCVGESWPLTFERAYYEYMALSVEKAACPDFVPSVYHFSKPNGLIVMQYLPPPNIILRKGLIQGIKYPTMAEDMGMFCANTLFLTSGFHLSAKELREKVKFWSANADMCELTEQVVFTEPYIEAPNNRWTSPQLDQDKKDIENDNELKQEAAKWKTKFVQETQALIHGDLHSGSVMCSPKEKQTFVIDPEFAFYGPMGFDTGAFTANLFLAYVSQAGHKNGADYADWILDQIVTFWKTFETQFLKLWNDEDTHKGFVYGRQTDSSGIAAAQKNHMSTLLADTLGFAGMKMLRRIVGIAHVEDLDSIEDAELRSECERNGLRIAQFFIKTSASIESIESAVEIARSG